MISEPPLLGRFHYITTLDAEIVVVGALGCAGI